MFQAVTWTTISLNSWQYDTFLEMFVVELVLSSVHQTSDYPSSSQPDGAKAKPGFALSSLVEKSQI